MYFHSNHIYNNDISSNVLDTLIGVHDFGRTDEMYIYIKRDKTILHEVIL